MTEGQATSDGSFLQKKGIQPKFLSMTRTDFAAYQFLRRKTEAKEWIERCLGETIEGDFIDAIEDGVILCKLANKIWPNSIAKINPSMSYRWKMTENVMSFIKVLESHGLTQFEVFSPIDLTEKKNLVKVVNCIFTLSEKSKKDGFDIAWQTTSVQFTAKEIKEAKKLEGVAVAIEGNKESAKPESPEIPKKNVSEEEQEKRNRTQIKRTQSKKFAQDQLIRRQLEVEEMKKKQQEDEEKKKKDEEAKKNPLATLFGASIQRQMELAKKQEEEEKIKKAHEEAERKRKEEEARMENELAEKYGGKQSLEKIRSKLPSLELEVRTGIEGWSLLHFAVDQGEPHLVSYVIEQKGGSVHAMNNNNSTPLHLAVKKQHLEIAEILLQAGAVPNAMNREGNLPIHIAIEDNNDRMVKLLVKHGAEVDATNRAENTPLILAAERENAAIVEFLVKEEADVNFVNRNGETALHIVSQKGNISLVNELHKSGHLDLNLRNRDNATPLQLAAENEHYFVVKRLIELGADVFTFQNEGWTPLYSAAYSGNLDTVKLFVSKGAEVNSLNEEGWAPIHAACSQGQTEVVKYLVKECGAKVNLMTESGTTPLFHAAVHGNSELTQFLLENGADPNMGIAEQWKPIHVAAYSDYSEVTKLLINHKCDVNAKCSEISDYTPLQILISTDCPPVDIVELLLQNGADPNILNAHHSTALHLACFWGHLDIVRMLIEGGADTEIKNDKGRVPLETAARYGHSEVAEYIAEKTSKPLPKIKDKQRRTISMAGPNSSVPTPEKK